MRTQQARKVCHPQQMGAFNLIVDTGTPPDNLQKGVAHINVSVMAHWGISIGDLVSFLSLPLYILICD
jgi:hypothetical protein